MLSVFSFASRPLSFALRSMSSSTSSTTAVLQVLSDNVPPPDKTAKRELMLKVKRLSDNATLPTRGSAQAAGYDLYSAQDLVVPAEGKAIVPTDIAIAVPEGTYGRVAPRSGLAAKHHIDVGAGVIDADYRGSVGVVLFNLAKTDYQVKKGDRVAQLVLERIYTPDVVEVQDLDDTNRGSGGFGSTGRA